MLWSKEGDQLDPVLCEDRNLHLDPWPLVAFKLLMKDYTPSPFRGGFSMRITDSESGENGCNYMHRAMKFESDCLTGESVMFDFISENCLPSSVAMLVKQRTLIVVSWKHKGDHFIKLRRRDLLDLFCLRVPTTEEDHMNAFLFADLACLTEGSSSLLNIPSPLRVRYLVLHLQRYVYRHLCDDEYPQCTAVTCNSYIRHECHKSCKVCDFNNPPSTCSFPGRNRGQWFQYNLNKAGDAHSNGIVATGAAKPTKKEIALSKFKEKISDVRKPHHDDCELHKWLKARSYDVDKAADMYRASVAYKEKLRVDKITQEYVPPEVLQKYLTGGFCGHDKEGSPIRVELYGHLDMKGIMYSAKKLDLEKTKLLQCERTLLDWEEQSKKRGKRVDGLTVIFDMEGVSSKMLWRPGLQMYLHLVKVLEDNYPEMMKRMFVVNAPRIFPLLYKLARPLVSEDMKNKIHVLGTPRIFPLLYKLARPLVSEDMKNKIHVLGNHFKDTLLQYIDAEELPMFLGGVKTDPDGNPRCATLICQGGEVPSEYFLLDKENEDQLESVTVSRGDKLCLSYEVVKPGSVLRWEFKTDDFDIGFGVQMLRNGKKETVVAMERVNSHIVPEDGSFTCQQPGTYEVVFDNSFSWARAKRVQYMVEVIGPVDEGMRTEIKDMWTDQDSCTNLAW